MNQKAHDVESALQERAFNFVSEHVYYNINQIVSPLFKLDDLSVFDLEFDDLIGLRERCDYEDVVREHLDSLDEDDLNELLEEEGIPFEVGASKEDRAIIFFKHLISKERLAEFAGERSLEPERTEIDSYWSVSHYLAAKLEAKGEVIKRDFLGLTIWGRCDGGQMIHIDHVIRQIVREATIPILNVNTVAGDLNRLRKDVTREQKEGKSDAEVLASVRAELDRILGPEGQELAKD